MNYLVTGFKTEVYENNYGMEMQEENLIGEIKYFTPEQAEKGAKKIYDKGADLIEIIHLGGKDHAIRYWNPREGISSTSVNWAEEFRAGLEV